MLYLPFLHRFVEVGTLTVIDPKGTAHRLEGGDGPSATIRLHDASVSRAMFRNPALAVGEAYMDGRLTVEDGTLLDFLTIALVNSAARGSGAIPACPLSAGSLQAGSGRTIRWVLHGARFRIITT